MQHECYTFSKAGGMVISSANAVHDSQCGVKTMWHTTLRGRAKCVVVMCSPWKIAITPFTWLGRLSQQPQTTATHSTPISLRHPTDVAIEWPALDRSQVQTSARRLVCTVWFYHPQTVLAPSGATAVRPRLHRLVLPPLDHACTAWFHRR